MSTISAQEPERKPNGRSIYAQLGGKKAVSSVVDTFYERVLDDPDLGDFFVDTDMTKLRAHQVQFLTYALGGPIKYTGQGLRQAHAHLAIDASHVERVAGHLGDVLREAGVVFMFAPTMHPAMRHVGPVRRELAVPTVMNIVGPLANPASAGRQVVGVAERRRMPLLAGALAALGSRRALVVHGEPGMDEISPLGPTYVTEVDPAGLREWVLDPATLGVSATSAEELAGGSPQDNARIVTEILEGKGAPGARAAVVLNAAAAIYVGGMGRTIHRCVEMASQAIDSGAGLAALDRMRTAYARSAEIA